MSLTQTSFFCPPTNISSKKLSPQTNISFFPNIHDNNLKYSQRKESGKAAVLYNGYSYFTSPCHPLELELPKYDQFDFDVVEDYNGGIGIVEFFAGKNIFLTGATGLVGKVILEKMLRSTGVGKIYLLIKAEDKEAAFDRITKEIIDSDLFEGLRDMHGTSLEAFVRSTLIPVVGNICEPNLGMDSDSVKMIRKDVDVIIGSAASATLNERYDLLLDANVIAPQRLMRFAKTCKNLKLFTHISTAFVNGRKEGIILEEPVMMGENKRKDSSDNLSSIPRLDVSDEILMAFKSSEASTDYDTTKYLKKLGQERADLFGWHNPYHMTKAMGEMVLDEIREDIPLLIIRPSVIESVYKDPSPGWIQGNRMYDPVMISYGKGQLPAFFADPQVAMDIIPVDIVANATIAAIAKHGAVNKPQLSVYHVSSSALNPVTYSDFFEYLHEYFSATPLVEDATVEKISFFDNFKDFSEYTREAISRQSGQKLSRCKAKAAYAAQVCKMYEFAGFFPARFHTGNMQKLLQEMSEEERLDFEVDVMKIDWRKYFQEIHIPGLRKHVINGMKMSSKS
ncbi:fatty acyl-CoA reductase 2, chloroplastic-like isoform X1 [Andrographis paniculata]|uniref:fatty acyl-CoA reductase 2, chloroplastic-like isoform X1 n=1 Tax=Andrographis paniculata TaxID=175694 RepID=UPI0021E70740|nr:fatty acyl-CoA reductase 2, chloroplastic-like isoform X1 [Andrographis paniculata]